MRSLRPEGLCERDNRLTGAGRTKPTTWMRESRGMFYPFLGGVAHKSGVSIELVVASVAR